MNLRQLQYFVTVVDEGNFTSAAKRLYVAQPSLSKQIAALEKELGGPLIERLHRGIRLTPSGRAFLPEARAATLSAERAKRAARMSHSLATAELQVATVFSIAIGLLPQSIRALREHYPGVLVDLREYRNKETLEEEVRAGTADIAIGPMPRVWRGPVASLGWEEFVVLMPEGDPTLTTDGPIHLTDLADRRWVLPSPGTGMAPLVAAACQDAGFTPNPAVHSTQVEALVRFAATGLGPTLLPRNVIPPDLEHLLKHLHRPMARELAVYTRTEWSPIAQAFLNTLWTATSSPIPQNAFIAP